MLTSIAHRIKKGKAARGLCLSKV
ncbi:unnamed protein product [Victoria cruziana]